MSDDPLNNSIAPLPPEILKKLNDGAYYTQKQLEYRLPREMSPKESKAIWEAVTLSRALSSNLLPYNALNITYVLTPKTSAELHLLDQSLTKILSMSEQKLKQTPEIIFEALSDEAIFSSKLEGAVTTEIAAREMIRKKITPQTKDERMIMNNHEAMQFIRGKKDILLDEAFICEIQRIVTKETLEKEAHSGVFRSSDDIYVIRQGSSDVWHYPPKSSEIPAMISSLCKFVNADRVPPKDGEKRPFTHPLIVAIALHFLTGYIHPFYDGNGRTARTLFYWYVLSRGYDIFQYIPISKIIKQDPAKYRDAYLATEQDGFDLTYFIEYNISCIQNAREALITHVNSEMNRISSAKQQIMHLPGINKRQSSILAYMAEYPDDSFGIAEIAERFDVSYQTARTDLLELEAHGYLWAMKKGKAFFYSIDEELKKQF